MKIILTGYMASGKTTIGRALARFVHTDFVDLDECIAKRSGKSIATMIKMKGEIYFRNIEHRCLFDIVDKDEDFVLALGGGTPCYSGNDVIFDRGGIETFYLKASPSTLSARLLASREERPLLSEIHNDMLEEFVAQHLFERAHYYNKAGHIIDIDGLSVEDIVGKILASVT